MLSRTLIPLLILGVCDVFANVEKEIFLGPTPIQIPTEPPTIEGLRLHALSPERWTFRTHLTAEFPTNSSINGKESWFLLEGLSEGQRYEGRICWAATQPTSFRLSTYTLREVFETPELITSLAEYSESMPYTTEPIKRQAPSKYNALKRVRVKTVEQTQSILFLQIFSTADYYTADKGLMENVPPVLVDIILDPFILNIFPRSLLPTAGYLIALAIGSWLLAQIVVAWLGQVAVDDGEKKNV